MINYGRQDITDEDVKAVERVLRSDFLTQGDEVPAFENAVATRVGARYAVAVNSATSALHVACLALELGPGDLLWTVPNTFVASANCGRYCGADIDFVDIDPITWNISVPELRVKLEAAERNGMLPKVLVTVHFAGQPPEQQAIWELAQHYGFRVLEDASHAIGAESSGERVGSCKWSSITVFSFHPVKIVTTGEGGAAVTNDPLLAERMRVARSHGITRDAGRFRNWRESADEAMAESAPAPWYYEQQELGYNYRLTDIQAALGSAQLTRLDAYVARRNELAARYNAALATLPLQLPFVRADTTSAFHLYVVRLKGGAKSRHSVMQGLRDDGVGTAVHYMPVHLQPYYRDLGFSRGRFPVAEGYADTALTIPLYPGLSDGQQDQVIAALHRSLAGA